MEPPTATMVTCPAVSWWRRPDSGLLEAGLLDAGFEERAVIGVGARTHISEAGCVAREREEIGENSIDGTLLFTSAYARASPKLFRSKSTRPELFR